VVSTLQSSKVPKFQSSKVPGFQGSNVPRFQGSRAVVLDGRQFVPQNRLRTPDSKLRASSSKGSKVPRFPKFGDQHCDRRRRRDSWTVNPETLGTLELGTLEPWNPGTLEPWNLGTPWNPGTPWNLGTLEPTVVDSCMQPTGAGKAENRSAILQGTLDLMVLTTLEAMGPMHGYGIARRIEQLSDDALLVNQGTIYLCLIRLVQKRWLSTRWGTSENNRKAKFYAITAAGRKQLAQETDKWQRLSGVIARLLRLATQE
jgi:PadR family transcriptional regulator, regulatory protein PadR